MTPLNATSRGVAAPFPTTRYQGSKRRLADAILWQLAHLDFASTLDAFGGTGAIAHALKRLGKRVTYNDALKFNHQIGLALIENDVVTLGHPDLIDPTTPQAGVEYDDFIERTFHGIYFTREENAWLDVASTNIRRVRCPYRRAMLWFALFQAAMVKRPYNLFHRRNLYMRTAKVVRGFGNKAAWDRPFDEHFKKFAREANAAIVDGGGTCKAICGDAMAVDGSFDLVYVDPPYVSASGVGVDYHHFYHLLEGMMDDRRWPGRIDGASKHKRLKAQPNPWCDGARNGEMFTRLFERFSESLLVVSYRSDGQPSIEELHKRLRRVKRRVRVIQGKRYQYALSTNRRSREVLLIGA